MIANWIYQPLSELARIERGKFSARPRNDPRFFGGSIPFIQTGDVRSDSGVITRFASTLNEAGVAVSKVFAPDTLFMTIAANIGDVGVTAFEAACPDSLVALHPRRGVDKRWLYYALLASKSRLESIATLNAQPNINLEKLNPFELLVPPSEEQAEIGEVLDRVSRLTNSLVELIAKKRSIQQGQLQALLTGRVRLPGYYGEWKEVGYGDLISIRKGAVVPSSQPMGKVPIIAGGKKPAGLTSRSNRTGPVITIAASGSAGFVSLHRTAIWASDCSTIESGPGYDLDFIYWSLVLRQAEIYRAQRGGGQPHIYPRDIYGMTLLAPPTLGEQEAIGRALRTSDAEIASLDSRLVSVRAIKQGMMQGLLTGRTRVHEGVTA